MTYEEIKKELMRLRRNALDNAKAEALVAEAFKENYLAGLSKPKDEPQPTPEMHARSMELYDFYIGSQHRAKDWERKVEFYAATFALLQEMHRKIYIEEGM